VVWALPDGMTHMDEVPESSPARATFIQCGGSAAAMSVEIRVTHEDDSYEHYAVAREPAAGTGASSVALAKGGAEVVACDLSEGMIEVGRERHPEIEFVHGNAMDLDFEDGSFDAVTMSYGLRNVADYPKALSEIYRVLKPGGRIVILEFSTPTFAPFGAVYKNYIMKAIPPIARAISSNPESYEYLAESIIAWPNQQALAEKFKEAGFTSVQYRNLTGGIVAIHRGFKPAESNA